MCADSDKIRFHVDGYILSDKPAKRRALHTTARPRRREAQEKRQEGRQVGRQERSLISNGDEPARWLSEGKQEGRQEGNNWRQACNSKAETL